MRARVHDAVVLAYVDHTDGRRMLTSRVFLPYRCHGTDSSAGRQDLFRQVDKNVQESRRPRAHHVRMSEETTADDAAQPIRFDTKIAVLLREDLQAWQALNVCAFLMSGIAAGNPETNGEPYADADGNRYLSMFRQPVVVLEGNKEILRLAHGRALDRDLPMAIYTQDLFLTGNDRDNRATVAAVAREDLDLVGIAVYGKKNAVDKVMKGAAMHH